MLRKAYLEISNICNLKCSFCHGTSRSHRYMSCEEFLIAAKEIRKHTQYLYLHVMGEPLLHPHIETFLSYAKDLDLKVIITTNGTLLCRCENVLLSSEALHKVSISLHCYEANSMSMTIDEYLDTCLDFCKKLSAIGKICVLRLWNIGGMEQLNGYILEKIRNVFGDQWKQTCNGHKIGENAYIEWGERFEWPDENADICSLSHSCYGLRDQVGILCDGTVVPCCLDADGVIALGNIFERSLSEILESPRAKELKRSFETRKITEPLCQRCGFAVTRVK